MLSGSTRQGTLPANHPPGHHFGRGTAPAWAASSLAEPPRPTVPTVGGVKTRALGPYTVSAIGLGCMPMSMNSQKQYPDAADAVATIHAALDAGVTLLDTADCYAPSWDTFGHNEELVASALRQYGSRPDDLVVATKGGITRGPDDQWGRDGSPEYLRGAVEASLRRLAVETIDLYQWHRPDRARDYAEVVGTFKQLADEGKVRCVGISNANIDEIGIAMDVLGERGLASVQNEFSPRYRSSEDELQFCSEHGVAFLPWSPLGGTGGGARAVGEEFSAFADIAADHGVSPQQVVLAWELALSEQVIPIPGARRAASVVDSAAAADLDLSAEEVARCSAARADPSS